MKLCKIVNRKIVNLGSLKPTKFLNWRKANTTLPDMRLLIDVIFEFVFLFYVSLQPIT